MKLDDPDAILRCGNKVYLAELLARHTVPTPKTIGDGLYGVDLEAGRTARMKGR